MSQDTYTVSEVCEILRCGKTSVYEKVQCGEIPSVGIGSSVRIPKSWVDERLGYPESKPVLQTIDIEAIKRDAYNKAIDDIVQALVQLKVPDPETVPAIVRQIGRGNGR
jgi:excisionase family DNA binding protein